MTGTRAALLDGAFIPQINYLVFRRSTPAWRIKEHIVADYNLTLITKGRARYQINGETHEVGAGDFIHTAQGDRCSARTYPEDLMQCFSINFSAEGADGGGGGAHRQPQDNGTTYLFPPVSRIGLHRDLVNYFHELNYQWFSRDPGRGIRSRAFFFLIFHRLCELTWFRDGTATGDSRVKKICRYAARYYAKKITAASMARLTGLNPVYLGALFKKETGITFKRYCIETRVRSAENLLRSGEFSVGEAAELCGYTDVFYFYKQFKSVLGFAPSSCIPKSGKA